MGILPVSRLSGARRMEGRLENSNIVARDLVPVRQRARMLAPHVLMVPCVTQVHLAEKTYQKARIEGVFGFRVSENG